MKQEISNLIKKSVHFFDKFEDKLRSHLSRFPILYTFIGGIAIVLFWRGVWHTADMLKAQGGILGFLFYEPLNLAIVVIILLATGLFVSYFIGDTILISGLRQEKKQAEKTSKDIKEEEAEIAVIKSDIEVVKNEVHEIMEAVKKENELHHGDKENKVETMKEA